MTGTVGVLNVGAGDTKFVFDKNNTAECIRAGRIVKDMLRRGYALLVDAGEGKYQRVYEFDAEKCEYIIADLDPGSARDEEPNHEQPSAAQAGRTGSEEGGAPQPTPRGRGRRRRIAADSANAVAVGRTAGG